jgi:hypothetical protein
MVQVVVLALAAALSLASANQPATYGPAGPAYAQDPTGCDAACGHYYACKQVDDASLISQCTFACQAEQPTPQQTYQFAQLPCDQAVALIEGGGAAAPGGGASHAPGAPRPGDKECQGCKRWDDLCQYVVETAVGSGPYSGMVTDCPQTCCP